MLLKFESGPNGNAVRPPPKQDDGPTFGYRMASGPRPNNGGDRQQRLRQPVSLSRVEIYVNVPGYTYPRHAGRVSSKSQLSANWPKHWPTGFENPPSG